MEELTVATSGATSLMSVSVRNKFLAWFWMTARAVTILPSRNTMSAPALTVVPANGCSLGLSILRVFELSVLLLMRSSVINSILISGSRFIFGILVIGNIGRALRYSFSVSSVDLNRHHGCIQSVNRSCGFPTGIIIFFLGLVSYLQVLLLWNNLDLALATEVEQFQRCVRVKK